VGAPSVTPTPTVEGVRVLEPGKQLTDFLMTNQDNKPIALSEILKGKKLALLTFGYTHCPDVCPLNLANFKIVKNELGPLGDAVAFVFVTVDIKRDTPAVLKTHLLNFDPSFIGLSAPENALNAVTKEFGVVYKIDPPVEGQAGYAVTHSAGYYLVDVNDKLIRQYAFGLAPKTVATDLKPLLS
jgi:protein SCO1/2